MKKGFFSAVVAVLAISAAFSLIGVFFANQTNQNANVASMEIQVASDLMYDLQSIAKSNCECPMINSTSCLKSGNSLKLQVKTPNFDLKSEVQCLK